MRFTIDRDVLLTPLNLVAGVVERRQTLPILSNVLLSVEDGQLRLTGTDLEVELHATVALEGDNQAGDITVPGKKLADICKSLPDGSVIDLAFEGDKAVLKSGKSRFSLATLPAVDFPLMETGETSISVQLEQTKLKQLIGAAGFAMANQDVRYYLNGMLWEIAPDKLTLVATDGHRLALSSQTGVEASGEKQIILPRKAVLEVARLMTDGDQYVKIELGDTHFKVTTGGFVFLSKLVDGKFPDYARVIPVNPDKEVLIGKGVFKSALSRTAILSNEKFRGVRLGVQESQMLIQANNPEQEEAQETIDIQYDGPSLEIGFNVSYLLDVMGAVQGETIKMRFVDANSSSLITQEDGTEDGMESKYVVMPMRL